VYAAWIIGTEIGCTNLIDVPRAYAMITLWASLFHQVWKTATLIGLLYQMKKCAHFEFQRLVFPTTAYFIMDFISYSIAIFIFTFFRMADSFAIQYNQGLNLFLLTMFLLNIPHIIVGLSIIYLKDFKDPI